MRKLSIKDRVCFFSAFLNSRLPPLPTANDADTSNAIGNESNYGLSLTKKMDDYKTRSRGDQEGTLYDGLDETQPIAVSDGFVTFCCHFKYLGSFVSFSLCDNFDIKHHVTTAIQEWEYLRMFGIHPTSISGASTSFFVKFL